MRTSVLGNVRLSRDNISVVCYQHRHQLHG